MRHLPEASVHLVPSGFCTEVWAVGQLSDWIGRIEEQVGELGEALGSSSDTLIDSANKHLHAALTQLDAGVIDQVRSELGEAERSLWNVRPEKYGEAAYLHTCMLRSQLNNAWAYSRDVLDLIKAGK